MIFLCFMLACLIINKELARLIARCAGISKRELEGFGL